MRIRTYLSAFTVLFVIGVLHLGALHYGLYMRYIFYDVLMHFLGGLWVALSFYRLFYDSRILKVRRDSWTSLFLITVGSALAVGIAWEVFEYVNGLTFTFPGLSYQFDTVKDLGMDSVGGMVAYLYYRLKRWKDFC